MTGAPSMKLDTFMRSSDTGNQMCKSRKHFVVVPSGGKFRFLVEYNVLQI